MTQTHTIVEGPHLLFTGGNGHKCYGITVRTLDEEDAKARGHQLKYNINDYSIAAGDLSFLGLDVSQEIELKSQVAKLARNQE